MRCAPVVLAASILVALAGCASAPPGLRRVAVESGLQTNDIVPVPGGRYVLVHTAGSPGNWGPFPRLLLWDEDLDVVGRVPCSTAAFGVSADGTRVLLTGILRIESAEIPDLDSRTSLDWPRGYSNLMIWGVPSLPGGDGWCVVNPDGRVLAVDAEPLRVRAVGQSAGPRPDSTDIDDATGLLVATTRGANHIAAFEVGAMQTRFVVPIQCDHLAYDVAAAGGTAWIATDDGSGTILEFDLRAQAVRRTHDTGLRGFVRLARSADRRHLATLTTTTTDGRGPAQLHVYRIDPEGLTAEASLRTTIDSRTNDVAVVPEWGLVLIAGTRTFAWHYAESENRGD